MDNLSDELLIEVYYQAIDLQLSEDFIQLLKQELNKRNISVKE